MRLEGDCEASRKRPMKRQMLAMSLHSAALLLGIWVGPRIGFRLDSKGLGWVFGMALIVGISAVLVWIGFPIASP